MYYISCLFITLAILFVDFKSPFLNNWTCKNNELKMNSICCYQRRLKNFNWWITNCSWPGTYTHPPFTHTFASIRTTWGRIESIRNKLWHIAMLGLGFRGMQKSGLVGNNSPTDKWCWVRVARSLSSYRISLFRSIELMLWCDVYPLRRRSRRRGEVAGSKSVEMNVRAFRRLTVLCPHSTSLDKQNMWPRCHSGSSRRSGPSPSRGSSSSDMWAHVP